MSVAMVEPGDLKARVDGDGLVLVECWAPTCGACKVFDPVFESVADKHPEHLYLCPVDALKKLKSPSEADLKTICVDESENPQTD